MRVVVLTTYFRPIIGGVESSADRLARFLARSGAAVRVVTKRITPDLPDVESAGGVGVARVGPRGERDAAGKWRLIPAAVGWLVRHRAEYDVVCCIDYRGVGCAALLARRVTRRPVVFQAQTTGVLSAGNADATLARVGLRPGAWPARALKAAVSRLYAGADAFACISHGIEAETRAAGIEPSRIHFLPNPVDTTHFRPADPDERRRLRADVGVVDGRVVVAFAGRLSREKGVADLLEAWRRLSEDGALAAHGASPLLLVAGPDMPGHPWNLGEWARAFSAAHGLDGSVRFLGPLRDVAPLYRAADVAVVPSHFEALGLSALEALACGTPVVATAVGGLLDFMVDGVNGALCPPESPAALADALRPLLTDPGLRSALAARAREAVVRDYDEAVVLGRFTDLLTALSTPR